MQGTGHHFLAGAGFAGDEHGGIGARHLGNALAHLLQGRARANEAIGGPVGIDFVNQIRALLLDLRLELFNLLEGKQIFESQSYLGHQGLHGGQAVGREAVGVGRGQQEHRRPVGPLPDGHDEHGPHVVLVVGVTHGRVAHGQLPEIVALVQPGCLQQATHLLVHSVDFLLVAAPVALGVEGQQRTAGVVVGPGEFGKALE